MRIEGTTGPQLITNFKVQPVSKTQRARGITQDSKNYFEINVTHVCRRKFPLARVCSDEKVVQSTPGLTVKSKQLHRNLRLQPNSALCCRSTTLSANCSTLGFLFFLLFALCTRPQTFKSARASGWGGGDRLSFSG